MLTKKQINFHCEYIISRYIDWQFYSDDNDAKPFMYTYLSQHHIEEISEKIRDEFKSRVFNDIKKYGDDCYNILSNDAGNELVHTIASSIWRVHAGILFNKLLDEYSIVEVEKCFVSRYSLCIKRTVFEINKNILDNLTI